MGLASPQEVSAGVGDTVVVCRPDQLREAAIVVSCLPADRMTPVVTVDPPPMPEAEYIALYEELKRSQDGVQQVVGTDIGKDEAVSAGRQALHRLIAQMGRTDGLRELIASYRSWIKRNELVSSLVTGLGIQRAVLLDDFAPEELNAIDPALAARWHGYRAGLLDETYVADQTGERMLDSVPEQIRLPSTDLTQLTSHAWQLLRDLDRPPERVIEVPADDPTVYVEALFTALRTGAALHAVEHAAVEPEAAFSAANPDAEEAVLVENTGSADSLLGAIYAHHRAARLVITPRPDLRSVQTAIAEQQRRITAAARSVSEEEARGPAFLDALWRVLAAGGGNPFAEVESAVTKQVPPSAIAEVGGRRLTAFTTGIPYSFVRTGTADWSSKPIGHVAADAVLIILNELYGAAAPQRAAAFSLVFDPGFFRVSETKDVMRAVGTHLTHPILLSERDTLLDALVSLPKELPVELIFFNTHGSDDSILLGNIPLRNSLIPQWLTLSHRPIIFNNSCLSWTGVGSEFIRVGARGYIGSLWSIPSKPAADFARVVVDRLTVQEMPACEAIVGTGLRAGIERSYLYVGTVAGRLDHRRDHAVTGAETALAACAILDDAAGRKPSKLSRVLHREITALRRTVEGTPQERTPAYVDVLLTELRMLTWHESHPAGGWATEDELIARIEGSLNRLDLPPEEAKPRWADRFHATGMLHNQRNEWTAALADFGRCAGYGEFCRNRASVLHHMATIHMQLGDWEQAQSLAHASHDLCKEQQNRDGTMRAMGLLGQLSKRLERYDEAMTYAEEGHALAVKLQNRGEQVAFKLDQSTLHLLQGETDAAIAAATRALELSRLDHDERKELTALGRLGSCHRIKGDLAAAERYAVQGLAQARRIGDSYEVVCFTFDIAELLTLREQYAEALDYYRESAALAVKIGAWSIGGDVLAGFVGCASRQRDGEALWSAAMLGSHICIRSADERLRLTLQPIAIHALKEAARTAPAAVIERRVLEIDEVLPPDDGNGLPPEAKFLVVVLWLLGNWLRGNPNAADLRAMARDVDRMSGGELGFAELVDQPYAGPVASDGRKGRWQQP
ncbi:tetratricopeptide repeat protein [Streptomyces sp. PSAA01]|uniref:tetratricopeptide repeat protein n=1 Tax=Streptomyces sp. PSAA01 TaxID=2912762 RepID=UPI001F25B3C5|nr:tetratricopeptide repeat protein [Streptomyces sp. PSAA01]MCG0283922.1 tetratricopeptide repeat protein [Streptomyces sp. PSAA01]